MERPRRAGSSTSATGTSRTAATSVSCATNGGRSGVLATMGQTENRDGGM